MNHIELGEQNGAEVLEISIPAEMATENVGSPWGDREVVFNGRVASQTSGVAWWSESIRLFRIMVDVATPFSPRGNFFHA